MVPVDCPAQLMDLVLDCCSFLAYSRPDFEKIVTRLLGILYNGRRKGKFFSQRSLICAIYSSYVTPFQYARDPNL